MKFFARIGLASISTVVFVGAASPANAAIIFKDAYLLTSARADVYANTVAGPIDDTHSTSASSISNTPISVNSEVNRVADGGSASAKQSASLGFLSPNDGAFDLSGSINTQLTSPSNGTAQASVSSIYNDRYEFETDTPVILTLNYSVSGTKNGQPDPNSALGAVVSFYNSSQVYSSNLVGSGSTQVTLQAGTYDLFTGIYTEPDYLPTSINAFGPGSHEASYAAHLGFNIASTTPEPASWAMMIFGVGMAGATQRSRRRQLATA